MSWKLIRGAETANRYRQILYWLIRIWKMLILALAYLLLRGIGLVSLGDESAFTHLYSRTDSGDEDNRKREKNRVKRRVGEPKVSPSAPQRAR
jgi:hypothetical protein